MTDIDGLVTCVYDVAAGSELTVIAGVGNATITVSDSYDFNEDGGVLILDGVATYNYTKVDHDTNIITLVGTVVLLADVGAEVLVSPAAKVRWAMIDHDDDDEGTRARLPHGIKDKLKLGIREEEDQERVVVSDDGGRLQVTSVGDEYVVMTASVFQSDEALGDPGVGGFRFEDDTAGGVLKFWTGTPSEVGPGWINPAVIGTVPLDVPGVEIASPDTGTAARSYVRLYCGSAEYRSTLHEVFGICEFNNGVNMFGALFGSTAIHCGTGFFDDGLNGGGSTTATISNTGKIVRTVSSRRYKDDIEPLSPQVARKVLDLEPVTFKLKDESEDSERRTYPGFIVEQAVEVGAELWVNRDSDGRPDGFRYAEVVAALIPIVRDQDGKIRDQQDRIDRLEARLEVLEAR